MRFLWWRGNARNREDYISDEQKQYNLNMFRSYARIMSKCHHGPVELFLGEEPVLAAREAVREERELRALEAIANHLEGIRYER